MLGSLQFSCLVLAAACALPDVHGHGYLLLPETQFTTDKKNFYAASVPATKVPPESDYWTGDRDQNSANFITNYKTLNPSSLKEFILNNEVIDYNDPEDRPAGGTLECGFSIPDASPAQPLPDHLEYGNYRKDIIHPGPCEVWCDDEIVVPFAEDCRIYQGIDIPYDREKCVGKSRLTFYWLATHFAPFQAYISCVPIEGGSSSGTSASTSTSVEGEASTNNTFSFDTATATSTASASSQGSVSGEGCERALTVKGD